MGLTVSAVSKETQQTTQIFCSAVPLEQGKAVLATAESIDHYRELCRTDRANALARDGQMYVYSHPTMAQRDALNERIQSYESMIPTRLKNDLTDIQVVPLLPSADGNMPHTRPPNLICLPMSGSGLTLETYIHELWHVHQRKYYDIWTRFFKNSWYFEPFKGQIPVRLLNQLRFNPDTMADMFWVWKGTWVPMCLFLDPVNPSFQNTAVWYYNVKTQIHRTTAPPEYVAFFSSTLPPSAYEHPCELSAYFLAGQNIQKKCVAYQSLASEFLISP